MTDEIAEFVRWRYRRVEHALGGPHTEPEEVEEHIRRLTPEDRESLSKQMSRGTNGRPDDRPQ